MADIADAAQINEQKERDAALLKFHKTKQYGKSCEICIDCGEPIAVDRKMASPASVRCMECQTDYEGADL